MVGAGRQCLRSLSAPIMAGWEPPAARHPISGLCPSQLLGLLSDVELGPVAADGFSLLMADSPDVLHKGCHADVRIMFRQRFFTNNVPKLVQGFHGAGPGEPLPPAWSHHPMTPLPGNLSWHPLLLAALNNLCTLQM